MDLREDSHDDLMGTICMPSENNISGTIVQTLVSIDMLRDRTSPPLETPMHKSGTGSSADDDGEETPLPPPLPYYGRDVQPVGLIGLRRTKSETVFQGLSLAKDSLASRQFNRSMPNLHCSRAQHNRLMGSTGDFRVVMMEKLRLPKRVEEFETLLADL